MTTEKLVAAKVEAMWEFLTAYRDRKCTFRERPIIFSSPMVRALLDGRKTQTRRLVKPQPCWSVAPLEFSNAPGHWAPNEAEDARRCPYGVPGDRLCYACGYDTNTERDSGGDQQRLSSGERRANLQPQEVPGLREIRSGPMESPQIQQGEQGLSDDLHESSEQAGDQIGASARVSRVSRPVSEGLRGASSRWESSEQRADESSVGNADRAMARSSGARASGVRREAPRREVHGRGEGESSLGRQERPLQPEECRPCPRCGTLLRRGDLLWVREALWHDCAQSCMSRGNVRYAADCEKSPAEGQIFPAEQWVKVPSIHMPRWASRITLEITDVRVQRVGDISEEDAIAEGVETHAQHYGVPEKKLYGTTPWYRYDDRPCSAMSAKESYATLWDSINGPGSWASNPWVWAITFKVIKP